VRRRAGAATLALCACVFVPPPPLPDEIEAEQAARQARAAALAGGAPADSEGTEDADGDTGAGVEEVFTPGQPAEPGMTEEQIRAHAIAQGDPKGGDFGLDEALAGLTGEGELWVRFETARGPILCELLEDDAPRTVANFVGLARGLRPWLDRESGGWVERPYYDGTTFHRVVPGFMIQGGDPEGTGLGNPGYVIADEFHPDHRHDAAGRLSMANRGPNTGGGQFFITVGPAMHLDGKHTIFGICDEAGLKIADDISLVPRDAMDKPSSPEVIRKVVILRK
jgi:peptidyl-prolyl cis-trans isomerase A (cyclophilin A)